MRNRKRAAGVAAMALGLSVAVVAIVAVVGRGGETSVGSETLVNPPDLITVNNSPSVVRDPGDPEHLVISHRIDRPRFSALLEWSDDNGATWQPTTLRLPPGTEACAASPDDTPCPFAPDLAFGPDGTLYVLYVSLQGNGNTPSALWLATSTDGGRSLEPPVAVAGELTFQPRVTVDGDGAVHVIWLAAEEVGLNQLAGPARIVASRSDDGGQTFSTPVPVSDAGRERVGAASPVIDTDGDVIVLYEDFKANRRDFEGLEGPRAEEPFALVVTRSDDGGQTYAPGVELESGVVATERFLVFLPEFPSLAAGPDGMLFVAWADGRNDDEDVFLRRSDDGGATWSEAVRVNDNPVGDGTGQYLPRLSVAPDGRVDVLFYDRRADPTDVRTDVYIASSDDRGRTFTNQRVSTRSFDSRVGPTLGPDYGTDFGTRLGLTSTDRGAYAAWTDTRLGNQDNGRQDVFGAAITIGSGAGLVGWAVASGVVALLIPGAGLIWLILKRKAPT
ncbi:sialidase family protein [soil metagenome]